MRVVGSDAFQSDFGGDSGAVKSLVVSIGGVPFYDSLRGGGFIAQIDFFRRKPGDFPLQRIGFPRAVVSFKLFVNDGRFAKQEGFELVNLDVGDESWERGKLFSQSSFEVMSLLATGAPAFHFLPPIRAFVQGEAV